MERSTDTAIQRKTRRRMSSSKRGANLQPSQIWIDLDEDPGIVDDGMFLVDGGNGNLAA